MKQSLKSVKSEFLSLLKYNYTEREKEQVFKTIMEVCWDISPLTLLINQDHKFNHQAELLEIADRLNKGEPLQYITGKAFFRNLVISVDSHVLIPRPETEELVGLALSELKQDQSILDLGTGSGCIALSLKEESPKSQVSALDFSKNALSIAELNSTNLGLEVKFYHKSMDVPLSDLGKFDHLISNPPYIGLDEKTNLEKNVVAFEPEMALFSINEDPLYFYKCLFLRSLEVLKPRGFLFLELHENYAEETAEIFKNEDFSAVEILNDFQGKKRFLKAQKG